MYPSFVVSRHVGHAVAATRGRQGFLYSDKLTYMTYFKLINFNHSSINPSSINYKCFCKYLRVKFAVWE